MIHYLLNDFSWCNEQSYSGKKGLPSLGIKPETFHFSLSYEAGITRQGETSWQGREFNVQKAFYNPNSFVFNFNKTCLKGKHYQKLHHIKLCLAYYVVLSLEITPFIDYLCAIGTTPSYLKLVIGQGKQHNLIPHLSLFMAWPGWGRHDLPDILTPWHDLTVSRDLMMCPLTRRDVRLVPLKSGDTSRPVC